MPPTHIDLRRRKPTWSSRQTDLETVTRYPRLIIVVIFMSWPTPSTPGEIEGCHADEIIVPSYWMLIIFEVIVIVVPTLAD